MADCIFPLPNGPYTNAFGRGYAFICSFCFYSKTLFFTILQHYFITKTTTETEGVKQKQKTYNTLDERLATHFTTTKATKA